MNLKTLFIGTSLLLFAAKVFSQDSTLTKIVCQDFLQNNFEIDLTNKENDVLVIFVNANKCLGCVEEIGKQVNDLINCNHSIKIYYLIRVGNVPTLKREMIDMLNLSKTSKDKVTILFDIENDATIGVESNNEVQGNFKKFKMYHTPGLIICKHNKGNKLYVYNYDNLFNPKSLKLNKSLLKLIK